jgi:hypothetical protein
MREGLSPVPDRYGPAMRVYGGAVPASRALVDYRSRASVEPESKQRIATRAAQLIKPGDRVIMDGGTTTLAITRVLPPDLQATVITHSPTIAAALVDHPTVEILMLGGRIYKHSAVACGAATAEAAPSPPGPPTPTCWPARRRLAPSPLTRCWTSTTSPPSSPTPAVTPLRSYETPQRRSSSARSGRSRLGALATAATRRCSRPRGAGPDPARLAIESERRFPRPTSSSAG